MEIPISRAGRSLSALIRRADAGEEILLTRHGEAVARLLPLTSRPTADEKRRILLKVRADAPRRREGVPEAAVSHHCLYDAHGLPR